MKTHLQRMSELAAHSTERAARYGIKLPIPPRRERRLTLLEERRPKGVKPMSRKLCRIAAGITRRRTRG